MSVIGKPKAPKVTTFADALAGPVKLRRAWEASSMNPKNQHSGVIGKPKAPKATTSSGVPEAGLCERNGIVLVRIPTDEAGRNYRCVGTGEKIYVCPHAPVQILDVVPRHAEPDAALTTYGELGVGEYWTSVPSPTVVHRKSTHGYTAPDGSWCPARSSGTPVRRVPASVVVHEEPGTFVEPCARGGEGGPACRLMLDAYAPVTILRDEAEHLACELAAWLAGLDGGE